MKGWKAGASWSFPRGKKNKDEEDPNCAIREVWLQTSLKALSASIILMFGGVGIYEGFKSILLPLYIIICSSQSVPLSAAEMSGGVWGSLYSLSLRDGAYYPEIVI